MSRPQRVAADALEKRTFLGTGLQGGSRQGHTANKRKQLYRQADQHQGGLLSNQAAARELPVIRWEQGLPAEKTVIVGPPVTGAVLPGDNAYAVSQALSWLAKERRDIQEQLEWQRRIPELMRPLLGKAA